MKKLLIIALLVVGCSTEPEEYINVKWFYYWNVASYCYSIDLEVNCEPRNQSDFDASNYEPDYTCSAIKYYPSQQLFKCEGINNSNSNKNIHLDDNEAVYYLEL